MEVDGDQTRAFRCCLACHQQRALRWMAKVYGRRVDETENKIIIIQIATNVSRRVVIVYGANAHLVDRKC